MSTPPLSTTPTPASSSSPFPFPPEYSFPPFFTRQTNLTTHHAQLTKWSALVLAYARHHRILKLSLSPNSPATSTRMPPKDDDQAKQEIDTSELFHNARLNRQLAARDVRAVIDFLRKDGRAEYVAGTSSAGTDGEGSGSGGEGDMAWVYWRTPEEWAALVEGWVDATGQKGSVLTVYELVEGEGTKGAEFHGLDQELLLKALGVLVKRGKAQVFGQEDSQGVKFF
ncbi:ESCRT-II complex subunit-domain-containing protein [Staphylotrichum tortipilum]|uniref:ESCRT-II complex subunit VPS25 n=1 Tax=Staphylotrichum tortipilum TaxID=2831512 RepID=A0AAN6MLQ3_9PEZI|nr:ESCRT-II complex subunit-domain-containing protein [Staphylotrichum longicolle]